MQERYLKRAERFGYYFATIGKDSAKNEHQQDHQQELAANQQGINKLLMPTFGKNLVPQFEYLKEFASRYNLYIGLKRAPLEQELHHKNTAPQRKDEIKRLLATDPYQTLKAPHLRLMREMISIVRQDLEYNNRYLKEEGLNTIDPEAPFHIEVSYPGLIDRMQVGSESTIYRQIKRLMAAEFILPEGKIFHGTNAPLELLLNPKMLLILDQEQPDYRPSVWLPTQTEKCGLQAALRAKCNHIVSLKRLGNSLTEEMWNSSQAQNQICSPAEPEERTSLKRTPKKRSEGQWSGQASDPEIRAQIRAKVQEKKSVWSAADFGGDFQKLKYAQVFLVLQAALKTLWINQKVYTGLVRKTETYLLEHYFKWTSNQQELDDQVLKMLEVIQHNSKYIAADPQNRFALLPLAYFNVKRKPKNDEDYSGFMGQLRLLKKRDQWTKAEQKKQQVFAQRKDLQKLRSYLRKVDHSQLSLAKYQRCRKWVAQNSPLSLNYFEAWAAYGQPLPAQATIQ